MIIYTKYFEFCMGYWTKTLVTCAAAGIIGAYAGTYATVERVRNEEKCIAELVQNEQPENTIIMDINNDWKPDVVVIKNGKYKLFLGQSDGSFSRASTPELDKKVMEQVQKL
jgi:hypothetical protein